MVVAAAFVAAAFPAAAAARGPTVELVPVNDVTVFSGADSPCPFDLVFTSTGTVKMTTFYDNSGTPIRQSVQLTFAADATELAFDGRSVLDVAALCAALAP